MAQPTLQSRIIPFPVHRRGRLTRPDWFAPWLSLLRVACFAGAAIAAWGVILVPVFLAS